MLAPVIAMKRTLTLLFALLALGTIALAASLPSSGTVTVTNDSGTQVGTGTISNGHLSLSLDSGTSGFVTITVTDGSGNSQSYDAMVKAGGTVTIVAGNQFTNLPDFAKSGGMDSVDVTESTTNHASATGQQEKQDNAAAPNQEEQNAQAGDHSQGNGQVTGSKQPGQGSGGAPSDNSPDNGSGTSASGDTSTPQETETGGGDQVKVGTSLDNHTDTGSGSTDTSAGGSVSTDD